ncbi:MAG: type II secretion system protein GspM [Thermodesulfobacteriota bacterium]
MNRLFAELSRREKIVVGGGIVVLAAVVAWFAAVSPYLAGLGRAERRIDSWQQQLETARRLQAEYRRLQATVAAADRRMAASPGFSLLPFVEQTTNRLGVRDKLVAMRPQAPQLRDGYREEAVEIRLERLPLEQVVRLLHAIDNDGPLLEVKSLRIRPRFDDRGRLDLALVVSSLQKDGQ